ncbi:AAEL003175-PA [Aedes aegypti]|uniref:AAEL003175-PA n=1 Tax=Aedes aegypti TaxID=7159 RepID=Q17G89_AEDAE|nr:AAEL003175-PA [Aedes aegypti]
MVFIAAPIPLIPGFPSTPAPNDPPCGETEVIPPTVIPILFILYVDGMGLIFPPAILVLLIDVSG